MPLEFVMGERERETLTLDNFFKEARIFSFRAAPPKTRLSELTPSPSTQPLLPVHFPLSPPKPTPSKILVLIFTFFLNTPVLVSLLKEVPPICSHLGNDTSKIKKLVEVN